MTINQKEKIEKLFGKDAISTLADADAAINKMSIKELSNDLTNEQKAEAKKLRSTDRKRFNLDTTKREKKKNDDREEIVNILTNSLLDAAADDLEIVNSEREFTFTFKGIKYKVVLSVPRK